MHARWPQYTLTSFAYQCSPQRATLRPQGLHAPRSRKRMTATRPFEQFTNNSAKGPGTKGPAERPALWRSPARSTDGVHVATAPRARPHRLATCSPTYRRPVTPNRTCVPQQTHRTGPVPPLRNHASVSELRNLKIIHSTLHMHTLYANTFGLNRAPPKHRTTKWPDEYNMCSLSANTSFFTPLLHRARQPYLCPPNVGQVVIPSQT